MNRRNFFAGLFGAAAVAVAPKIETTPEFMEAPEIPAYVLRLKAEASGRPASQRDAVRLAVDEYLRLTQEVSREATQKWRNGDYHRQP